MYEAIPSLDTAVAARQADARARPAPARAGSARGARRRAAGALAALALLGLADCAPSLPDGHFRCDADSDCPNGFVCIEDGMDSAEHSSAAHCYRDSARESFIHLDANDEDAPDSAPPRAEPTLEAGPQDDGLDAMPPEAAAEAGQASDSGELDAATPMAPPAACEPTHADARRGSFVSPAPTGVDSDACGTQALPCATIARGASRSLGLDISFVYLDAGRYPEAVVLMPGLTLQGGFRHQDGEWTRDCSADRELETRIESPRSFALWAEYDGEAALESLSLETMHATASGQSLYGVFVRGDSTRLTLRDVRVRAGAGGPGSRGARGQSPGPAQGTCTEPGDGSDATAQGAAGLGATSGSWNGDGYVARAGEPGRDGQPGRNGTHELASCVSCVDACDLDTCTGTDAGLACGEPGAAGCGGAAAGGGGGGGGGGSSIALFAWGASVDVQGGELEAGDGGRGGPGGEPGEGGAGSEGAVGGDSQACTLCEKVSISGPMPLEPRAASSAASSDPERVIAVAPLAPLQCVASLKEGLGGLGGRGGAGSRGGMGGSGAGGHSYGSFAGGNGTIRVSPQTRIIVGRAGGSDEGHAAQGQAAAQGSD